MKILPTTGDEPIRWTLRSDLRILPSGIDEGAAWVVKDPLRLNYFHAAQEELCFLTLLDGHSSLAQILHRLQERFPDCTFSLPNLMQFLSSAVQSNLLRSTQAGFGSWLYASAVRRRASRLQRKFLSLLVHRFRGIDPTPLLNAVHPYLGWIYRPATLLTGLLFVVFAAMLVVARFRQLELELPTVMMSLMTAQNLPWIAASVVFVKILHEFGHALTCRHYGGECHELGILLIGFVPLMYCDVSDSWAQQNRWKRMLVAAAGIGTELFLAALFGVLWVFSVPGLLHAFCLNAMIVCSVNTLLINGNPLLRYDGYYVLSDLTRIPNLSAEARTAFLGWFNRLVFGTPAPQLLSTSPMTSAAIALYGLCSTLYRLLIVVLILLGVHQVLKSVGLESLSVVLVLSALTGQLLAVTQVVQSARRESPSRSRFRVGLVTLLTVVTVVSLVPVPCSVVAPFVVTPGLSTPVFVQVEGYVEPHVSVGQFVAAGQPIATLRNPDLQLELERSRGELAVNKARVDRLNGQRFLGSEAANAIPSARDAVAASEARLRTLQTRARQLLVKSPAAGCILPPRNLVAKPTDELDATSWSGLPLETANLGVWQSEQTLLCWVGTAKDLQASAAVAQNDVELIRDAAEVTFSFTSAPGVTQSGIVHSRSQVPERTVARELAMNQMISVSSTDSTAPLDTLFTVKISLTENEMPALLYSTGYARIQCEPMSLARRGWRMLCHTFSFRL
jgi:putative peptide zinc metalloprotease protein